MSAVSLSPRIRAAYFDQLAPRYDEVWTHSTAGRSAARSGVAPSSILWSRRGDRVLDIGCGTGEDALHLAELGAQVLALESLPRWFGSRAIEGSNARVLPIEGIHALADNLRCGSCPTSAASIAFATCRHSARAAGAIGPPRRFLAICLMGRFCLRESAYYAVRGQFRKAFRRWREKR